MRSFVIVVILGFLATIAVAASTKRDPQSTNRWRPGKKDDTNLPESPYEEDSSYEPSPNDWNLDDPTFPMLGDQETFKGIPPEFPRPGRKRSNFDISYYRNYPAGEYSRGLGNGFGLIRPGKKRDRRNRSSAAESAGSQSLTNRRPLGPAHCGRKKL